VDVDDIVLIGNNIEKITHITTLLHQHFKIKNLGDLTFFLGLEVARSSAGSIPWIFYTRQGCLTVLLSQHLWSILRIFPVTKVSSNWCKLFFIPPTDWKNHLFDKHQTRYCFQREQTQSIRFSVHINSSQSCFSYSSISQECSWSLRMAKRASPPRKVSAS